MNKTDYSMMVKLTVNEQQTVEKTDIPSCLLPKFLDTFVGSGSNEINISFDGVDAQPINWFKLKTP